MSPRRAALLPVGQAGRIAEGGAGHAQRMSLAGHLFGEALLRLAQRLGDHHGDVIGRFDDQRADRILDADRLAGTQPEPRRRLPRRPFRDFQFGIEAEPPVVDRLEEQIEGHHLGQRRRISARVGVAGAQDIARVRVDDDGRVSRLRRLRADDLGCHEDAEREGETENDRAQPRASSSPLRSHIRPDTAIKSTRLDDSYGFKAARPSSAYSRKRCGKSLIRRYLSCRPVCGAVLPRGRGKRRGWEGDRGPGPSGPPPPPDVRRHHAGHPEPARNSRQGQARGSCRGGSCRGSWPARRCAEVFSLTAVGLRPTPPRGRSGSVCRFRTA